MALRLYSCLAALTIQCSKHYYEFCQWVRTLLLSPFCWEETQWMTWLSKALAEQECNAWTWLSALLPESRNHNSWDLPLLSYWCSLRGSAILLVAFAPCSQWDRCLPPGQNPNPNQVRFPLDTELPYKHETQTMVAKSFSLWGSVPGTQTLFKAVKLGRGSSHLMPMNRGITTRVCILHSNSGRGQVICGGWASSSGGCHFAPPLSGCL